jgi:hypothetical protein
MHKGRGTRFDPDVLDAFLEAREEFRQIAGRIIVTNPARRVNEAADAWCGGAAGSQFRPSSSHCSFGFGGPDGFWMAELGMRCLFHHHNSPALFLVDCEAGSLSF